MIDGKKLCITDSEENENPIDGEKSTPSNSGINICKNISVSTLHNFLTTYELQEQGKIFTLFQVYVCTTSA